MRTRCLGHCFIPYLVLLVITADAARDSARTLQITQDGPVTLTQALQDSNVDTIVLGGNYSAASELSAALPAPINLLRNVTIEGPAAADPPVTLDLAFKRAVIILCPTCTVTLKQLVLKNGRRGSGAPLDFFAGGENAQTAAVLLKDVWRLRLACPPGGDVGEVVKNTPRSRVLPQPKGKQQVALEAVTFQDATYPDSLRLIDATQDFPLVHLEGAGHATASAHSGGYALGSRNVVYLCQSFVSEACLAEKSPDACVNELIDRQLAQQTQQAAGVPLAAIIAPIVVVGALVTGLALFLLHRRRRRQRQQLEEGDSVAKLRNQPSFAHSFSHGHGDGHWPQSPAGGGSAMGPDSASDVHSTHTTQKSKGSRRSLEVAEQPHGRQRGWQLVSTATAPFVEPPVGPESDVKFGDFLGAGSYGRVYRARWAGRDVACKVIQHDRSTLAAVEAEADLMLSLQHPNVVKAYHYCTYAHSEPSHNGAHSRGNKSWSGNQRPSFSDSQSSKGSLKARQAGATGDSAHRLSGAGGQPPQPGSGSNSGSGSSARVLLLRRQAQAQQQAGALVRQDSSDVLVTNLSFDAQGVQEATAIADSLLGASSVATKESDSKPNSRQSGDDQGLFGAGEGAALKPKAETWLVQEYCDMGTLTGVASTWAMDDECDEQMLERLLLLQDTAQGLEALHSNHVVHADMNARNVLVSSCSTSEIAMCAKVADLGLARCLAHHATHRTTNSCGTMSHMSPELLRYGRLSPAVDVYSFGIMMWELYSQGQPAFDKLHYGQFFETVVLRKVRPCVPAGMPPDYELLMRQCWAADPADRPSVCVLRQCLHLMVQDRHHRVQAAAVALGAAAAPAASDAGSSGIAAGTQQQLPPPGVDTLPVLQALLPQSQRGPSPVGPPTQSGLQQIATGVAGAGGGKHGATLSPGNSSTPLSNISLSALFPDTGSPREDDTVLFIREDAAEVARAAGVAAEGPGVAVPAARPTWLPPVVGDRTSTAASGVVGSPSMSDLENQLEKDASVHSNRMWFV